MSIQHRHTQWLYLLVAFVLFMQSFAIWHDTSHPFHLASDECAKFEAVNHTPTADITSSVELITHSEFIELLLIAQDKLSSEPTSSNHPIRAPPHTFS
jgi:hypothetical protein